MAHSKTSSCRYVGKQATNETSPSGRLVSPLAVVEDEEAVPLEAAHCAERPPTRDHQDVEPVPNARTILTACTSAQ